MNDDVFSVDRIRVQIADPCTPWSDSKTINIWTCGNSSVESNELVYSRENCHGNKIIAWFPKNPRYPRHIGENGSQVVCRIIGNCSRTEIRDSVSAITFDPRVNISGSTTFSAITVYCDCGGGGSECIPSEYNTCCLGFYDDTTGYTINTSGIRTGYNTPIKDLYINDNRYNGLRYNGQRDDGNLPIPSSSAMSFVQYGTDSYNVTDIYNQNGDIEEDCIIFNNNVFFLYIPCGHYAYSNGEAKIGEIKNGAFKGLDGLFGLWIDSGSYSFKPVDIDDNNYYPFQGCRDTLQIVYCPYDWENYFTTTRFPELKLVNDEIPR